MLIGLDPAFLLLVRLTCPYCGEKAPVGASVCRGCGAEIVYGLTRQEKSGNLWGGMIVGIVVAIIFFRHFWLAYLLLAVAFPILLWWISDGRGKIRFIRRFEHG